MSLSQDKCGRLADRFFQPLLARLADLPAAEWTFLRGHLRLLALPRGGQFSKFGAVPDRFGVVTQGVLCKRHLAPDGPSFVRGFAAEGELVGAYVSLLTGKPSDLSVEALEDSEVLVVPFALMDTLYARHASWERIGRKLAENFLVERERRAAELLTSDATERYLHFLETHKHLLGRVREADIASYLGVTPVSLSRIKAQIRLQSRHDAP